MSDSHATPTHPQGPQRPPGTPTDAPMTYAQAGVDMDVKDSFVDQIVKLAASTYTPGVVPFPDGYAGFFELSPGGPVLVGCADGVGTKLKVAVQAKRHATVGIDLVAMNVNDALVHGARPLFFLDYLASTQLDSAAALDVVKGITAGCKEAGCALLGGETAIMPGFYAPEDYDLGGFCVGLIDHRDKIITGKTVTAGDVAIGLHSSGLHSNGFSLARRVLLERGGYQLDSRVPELGRTLAEELLTPTRIYVKPILSLLRVLPAVTGVKAAAHITGGGLLENIPRLIPNGLGVELDSTSWPKPPVFDLIQRLGRIDAAEMWRVFNNGIGFIVFVAPSDVDKAVAQLREAGETPRVIGKVVPRAEKHVIVR